jgi:hypothetical protein
MLSAEALAAFGAAAGNDLATILGGHTGAETVATSANEFAGLIRTLHDLTPKTAGGFGKRNDPNLNNLAALYGT